MKLRRSFVMVSLLVVIALAAACSPRVVTQGVQQTQIVMQTAVVQAVAPAYPASSGDGGGLVVTQANPAPGGAGGTALDTSGSAAFPSSSRMIIKNGNITLLVVDPDVALDRVTQVVGDVGGYIISSRVWFTSAQEKNYKNAP